MLTTLRTCLVLLGPGQTRRWAVVVLLALVAAGLEVVGALSVLGLLIAITSERSGFDLPLVGDLRALLPGTDELELLTVVAVLLGGFFVLRAVVLVAQIYVQNRMAENAGARLSVRLFEGYLHMPLAFHLRRNSAELVRNSHDIVHQFAREGLLPAVKLVSQVLMVVGVTALLLVTSPVATLLAVGVLGPFTWLLLRILHPQVERLGKSAQVAAKTSLQTLAEGLAGWRDLTVLGRQAPAVRRFEADRRRMARARYLRSTAGEVPRVVLETGLVLFVLGFLGLHVLLEGGALDALPVLGLFGYAAVRLQPSINEILVSLNALKFVGPGLEMLAEDLRAIEREAGGPAGTGQPLGLREELRLTAVTVQHHGAHRPALTDVDLQVRPGEFLGVVGPTGSGKSTLVDVMLGLLPPTRGRVEVDGVDVATRRADWLASVGVVHQAVFLADATLRGNIALGLPADEIDDERVLEAVRLAQLEGYVAALPAGLDTIVGERGVRVSGGQRQRLAIARALYTRPQVLFFDEGTSALDSGTEAALMAALERLRGDRTIVAVAHRLSTVRSCDRVVLVVDGRLVDVAPFTELAERHAELLHGAR
jgi:ATP-binding cassette, subfamily B, bacterial PglK